MWRWGVDGSDVSLANLNSTLTPFDCVVDGSATASGRRYQTITSALSAGMRSIFVRAGTYTENVTISNNCVRIFGEKRPRIASATSLTDGTIITGAISIGTVVQCHISNLGIIGTTGSVLAHGAGSYNTLEGIVIVGGTGPHFVFSDFDRVICRDCESYGSLQQGFIFPHATTKSNDRSVFDNCRVYSAAGESWWLGDNTDPSANFKRATFLNCGAYNGNTGWGVAWAIGRRMQGHWIGCTAQANNGHGFWLANPGATTYRRSFLGCHALAQTGTAVGFVRETSSFTAADTLVGCVSQGNAGGNWTNWAGQPVANINA